LGSGRNEHARKADRQDHDVGRRHPGAGTVWIADRLVRTRDSAGYVEAVSDRGNCKGPQNFRVDSAGIKGVGVGEWQGRSSKPRFACRATVCAFLRRPGR
jgi:hypothetical protein